MSAVERLTTKAANNAEEFPFVQLTVGWIHDALRLVTDPFGESPASYPAKPEELSFTRSAGMEPVAPLTEPPNSEVGSGATFAAIAVGRTRANTATRVATVRRR